MLTSLLLLACQGAPAGAPASDAVASELRAHVQTLAGDAAEGRRSGTPAADRAAWYLAGALAAAGLEPAGEDGSWFQPFEIEMPPEPGACYVRLAGPEEGRSAAWEAVTTLAISATEQVEAPMVAVGYGVVDVEEGLDELPASWVRGKIVLMRRYTAAGPKAEGRAQRLGSLRTKIRNAAASGAAGVVLGTHPEDLREGGEGEFAFDVARGSADIPVVVVNPGLFEFFENWVQDAQGEVTARLEAEVLRRKATAYNVLGRLPGRSDSVVVVGGHYDHLGYGGDGSLAPGVRAVHNGADDNASGTAVVLEMADLAAGAPQPASTLLFALWSGEEEGLLGSQYWVQHPTVPLERVLCNLNLDMVGRLQEGSITVGSQGTAAAFGDALEALEEQAAAAAPSGGAELSFQRMEGDLPGGGGSDHMSFHAEEVPALFFFSGLHGDYHKPTDDWDKLDYPRMAGLARALAAWAAGLAGAPHEGAWAFIKPAPVDPHAGAARGPGGGVWFGSIPDYAARPEGGGMALAGTAPGGPAEKAGLKKGDVIRKLGADTIGDIYDFMDALGAHEAGDTIQVTILRDGKELVLPVTLATRSAGQ